MPLKVSMILEASTTVRPGILPMMANQDDHSEDD
jgi:hypothetical protein